MARLTPENVQRAKDLIGLYPQSRSALIPMLHLAQEQDGWLTPDAMEHVGELLGLTPAEVLRHGHLLRHVLHRPRRTHLVSVCTNIACLLNGGDELLEHAEPAWASPPGGTTHDGEFTLEEVECIALCGDAPCLAVNWRFFGDVTPDAFDELVDDLRTGRLADEVPPHGTLSRVAPGNRGACTAAGARRPDHVGRAPRGRNIDHRRRVASSPAGVGPRTTPWTLKTYLDTGGYEGLRKALSMAPEAVQAEVMTANLLGRGGAGFPVGRKWSMLAKADPVYLVVNGDESEPCTFKDHMLLEHDPHQIIEGTLISAYAIGAAQAFIFVRGEFALGIERMTAALNEAYAYGAVGHNIFGSGFSIDVVIHPGRRRLHLRRGDRPAREPRGQAGLSPHQAAVLSRRPRASTTQPTIVNNVESVSNIPWIVLNGGDGFAALGEGRSTGTRIFSLSGHVRQPANYEVEMGKTTFRDLIYDPELGGGIRNDNQLKAFIPGGASAPWFGPDQLDMALDQDEVGKAGSMLGSGSVIVMDDTTCMVRAAWRITRFFHRESCGQCTPCREGGGWLDKILHRIETGRDGSPTSTCSSTCATTSRPACRGRPRRPRSASSARRSPLRSSRPSRCSATSSSSTSRKGLSVCLTGPRRRSRRSPSRSTASRSRPARAR